MTIYDTPSLPSCRVVPLNSISALNFVFSRTELHSFFLMFVTCYSRNNKRDGWKQGRWQKYDPSVYWCAIALVPGSKEKKVLAKT